MLALPSMLRELVFLSIAVLRPCVAKDLTTKYGINSLGWGVRAFALGLGLEALNMSVHAAPVSAPGALPFLCNEGI